MSYGMPQVDFSTLGDLGKTYGEAQDKATLADLGQRLASGEIDYKEAAGLAAKANKLDLSMSLLKMGQEREAAAQFDSYLANQGRGQGQPAPAAPMAQPQPAMPPPAAAPSSPPLRQINAPPPAAAPPMRAQTQDMPASFASRFDAVNDPGQWNPGMLEQEKPASFASRFDAMNDTGPSGPSSAQSAMQPAPPPDAAFPSQPAPAPAPSQPPQGNPQYADAISSIESGGKYDALGPVTRTGDRAFGKYQVMGANVGPWTQEVLGQPMTPQQFLASPQAQDAVFQAKFGSYVQKYGPAGAAKAWFAGEEGMNNPNARDQLGTTVSSYADKFTKAAGPQTASLQGMPTPDTAPAAPPGQQVAQAPGIPVAPSPAAPPQSATPNAGSPPTTNPAAGNVAVLLRMMAQPGISQGQRDAIKVMAEHALKSSDLPPEQKDYWLAKTQGYQGTYQDFDLQRRRASATMINTAEGMDAAQIKARIAVDTHAVQDLSKKSVAGRAAIPLLDRMVSLADKVPGGWAGSVSPMIARAMSTIGVEIPEGLSNAELLLSMSRQFIPSVRDPGSTSNYEQQLYSAAVPGLSQSQPGRVKIANMFKAQIQRNNEILQVYRENIGSLDLDKKLRELDAKPIFTDDQRKSLEEEARKQSGQEGVGTSPAGTPAPNQAAPKPKPAGAPDNAKQAPDGDWYIDDPARPGKFMRVD